MTVEVTEEDRSRQGDQERAVTVLKMPTPKEKSRKAGAVPEQVHQKEGGVQTRRETASEGSK